MERNLCTESGCKAFCCYGPLFPPLKIEEEQIYKWFPKAIKTSSISLSIALNESGVFFKRTGDKYIIKIVHYCPNLKPDFNCIIEDDKPGPCRDFGLGQDDCTAVRVQHFLDSYRLWAFNQK